MPRAGVLQRPDAARGRRRRRGRATAEPARRQLPGVPPRQSFLVEMVGADDLPTAIALNSSIFNGARVVGPAIAGALVAAIGEAPCFFLNGASYLAVLVALAAMRLPRAARPPQRQP